MEPEYIERSENERPYARTDADIDLDIDQLNTSIQEGVETLQERRRVWERRKGKRETIACGLRYVGTWVMWAAVGAAILALVQWVVKR